MEIKTVIVRAAVTDGVAHSCQQGPVHIHSIAINYADNSTHVCYANPEKSYRLTLGKLILTELVNAVQMREKKKQGQFEGQDCAGRLGCCRGLPKRAAAVAACWASTISNR